MARSTFVYVTYIRTTPEKLWSALTDAGVHEAVLVRRARRERVDGRIVVEAGVRRRPDPRRRRDRRGRAATAPGDPLAEPVQARAQGRGRLALHDGAGAESERRSSSPSPTPSSANRRSSSRRCPAAGRRSSPTSSRCWRPAPPFCRTPIRRLPPADIPLTRRWRAAGGLASFRGSCPSAAAPPSPCPSCAA